MALPDRIKMLSLIKLKKSVVIPRSILFPECLIVLLEDLGYLRIEYVNNISIVSITFKGDLYLEKYLISVN
jgi:hypothetical protein